MSDPSPGRGNSGLTGELGVRSLSALVLVGIAIVALWAGPWPFGVLVAVVAAAASWEWGRMVRGVDYDAYGLTHAAMVILATFASIAGYAVPASITLVVGAIVLIIVRFRARDALTGLGVLAIGIPAIGLAHLRADNHLGLEAVLFLFVVVWATDIGGYIFGRAIGGPKLLPAVSPSKTWAGAIGGLVMAALVGAATGAIMSSRDLIGYILIAIMLGFAAEIGDLTESALKRRSGRKDASGLIPGHGGVLDRIDGLLFSALVALLFAMLRNPLHPAEGLLLWP